MPQQTAYSHSHGLPDFIVRAKTQTLECPVYSGSTLTAPSSGTVTIYEGSTVLVDAAAVTITADIAIYSLSAATIPTTLSLSDNWLIVWELVIGGETHTFQRTAALVRRELHPVVTPADLSALHQDASSLLASGQTLADFLDQAWDMLQRRLLAVGRRPYLVLSDFALFDSHRHLAAYLLFNDAASSVGDGRWAEMAEHHLDRYEQEWSRLSLTYDMDEDGLVEDVEQGTAGPTAVFFGGPGVGV
tara:strand:+ start:145 stop:879 length:735 start_codon:yes stop_codon:yes gene_type:complete